MHRTKVVRVVEWCAYLLCIYFLIQNVSFPKGWDTLQYNFRNMILVLKKASRTQAVERPAAKIEARGQLIQTCQHLAACQER